MLTISDDNYCSTKITYYFSHNRGNLFDKDYIFLFFEIFSTNHRTEFCERENSNHLKS